MNAGVAKPIPRYLVYSRRVIDPVQRLLQRGPDRHVAREALAIQTATKSRNLRKFASVTLMLRCTLPTYRAAPLPISANGPQTAGQALRGDDASLR
jgi:hypothetical protein